MNRVRFTAFVAAVATSVALLSVTGTSVASPARSSAASSPTSEGPVRAFAADDAAAKKKKKKKNKGYRPAQGPKFNVPRSAPGPQFIIERQVLKAIRKAKPKSYIKMSMFSFDRFPVADALINAHKRGVRIQVLVNDHEVTPAQVKLWRYFGKNKKRQNFVTQCHKGCRSEGDVLHTKFITFSKTGQAEKVVMLGSVNMKLNGAKNQFNDLLTMNGVGKLHDTLVSIFKEMRKDKRARPMYFSKDINEKKLRILPWYGKPKDDPIMRLLRPIKCVGAKTANGRTEVLINMHAWDGDRGAYVAQRVRELWGQGCNVRVQYGYGGRRIRQIFSNPTHRGRVPVRSNGMDTDEDGEIDLYSHMKMVTINGRYGKQKSRKVAITGSSNFQTSGIRGDELVFSIFNARHFFRYRDHFNWMWNNKTRPIVPLRRTQAGNWVLPRGAAPEPTWPKDAWLDE